VAVAVKNMTNNESSSDELKIEQGQFERGEDYS
jgi:hypothetical protein